MTIFERQTPTKNESLQIANHLFFIAALLFVAYQNLQHSTPLRADAPMIVQSFTLNLQPRTPPPAYDPDQLSGDEGEVAARPERP